MGENNSFFLLIHTMTITQTDCVVQAQFFHTFSGNLEQARLVGKRMSLRVHPHLRNSRHKNSLQRLNSPNLRTLLKKNAINVKHHLRTVHINPPVQNNNLLVSKADTSADSGKIIPKISSPGLEHKEVVHTNNIQLNQYSSPEETTKWLSLNRFEKYLDTFERFSGDDMFRMSREDLIQICGSADGIRLHNAIHLKTIAPKLKIYVCRENSSIFNAIFLTSHSNEELILKLSAFIGMSQNQIRDVYLEGPQSIHIQLNNDVLEHIKEETMFSVQVISQESGYVLLLKRTNK
ncbi:unnamed protein product [Diabrotica balteata]|uniref:SAM domain-containing protein n=1 Tax=Diabrotica balteata TaxID=107213 RepID=A0A9N9SWN9_DIABA|nr:unnamed protein product [Diabrotica balteata]